MRFVYFILFLFLFEFIFSEKAEIAFIDSCGSVTETEVVEIDKNAFNEQFSREKPNPILALFKKKQRKNKRITAALLAFPFPFGIVGLHRIYLGTKPYVPVAYIGSLGGVFGILPFIDFWALLFDKDFDHYIDNGKVLMWIR
jgi:TM2 domain-containing membrane protein YozV